MARGPQIHQMVKATLTAATAAFLLLVTPAAALASSDGSTTPIDGFAAGAMANKIDDGTTTSIDGFAAGAMASSDDAGPVTDGWANRSTPSISRDGWEVARIELPRQATVTDGWANRSDSGGVNLASLDGWAYGSVTTGSEAPVQVPTSPAPPRDTSPPLAELALAATVALLVAAAAGFLYHRHQHHLPV